MTFKRTFASTLALATGFAGGALAAKLPKTNQQGGDYR